MDSLETDGGLKIAGTGIEYTEYAVVAPLEQLFTGLRVGLPTLTVRCCESDMQIAIVPETNALIVLACVPIGEDGLAD